MIEFKKLTLMKNQSVLYLIGLFYLALNKIRYSFRGYYKPRGFPISEIRRSIEHDISVVERWLEYLNKYKGREYLLKDKKILELGPGADLGVGLIALLKGAKKYYSIDIKNLVKSVPNLFYEELFLYLDDNEDKFVDVDYLQKQLNLTLNNKSKKLSYVYCKDFDISVFKGEEFDLILSNAVFEHLDNIERSVYQLSKVAKKGCLFIAEIDLKTHSRWIRDIDPLNIYRYSDRMYNFLRFQGSPNRHRPSEYKMILLNNGWRNVEIFPLSTYVNYEFLRVKNCLNKRFQGLKCQMEYLSIMICAEKK